MCEFLGKFPVVEADSMLESVVIIKERYTRYYTLGEAGNDAENSKMAKIKRSEAEEV